MDDTSRKRRRLTRVLGVAALAVVIGLLLIVWPRPPSAPPTEAQPSPNISSAPGKEPQQQHRSTPRDTRPSGAHGNRGSAPRVPGAERGLDEAAYRIDGDVRFADGSAVVGASVELRIAGTTAGWATTSANGTFVVHAPPLTPRGRSGIPRRVVFVVRVEGRTPYDGGGDDAWGHYANRYGPHSATVHIRLPALDEVPVRLVGEDGEQLSGQVRLIPDAVGVPRRWPTEPWPDAVVVRTNSEGIALMSIDLRGYNELVAIADNGRVGVLLTANLPVRRGDVLELAIPCWRHRSVAVRVLRGGIPAAGVPVALDARLVDPLPLADGGEFVRVNGRPHDYERWADRDWLDLGFPGHDDYGTESVDLGECVTDANGYVTLHCVPSSPLELIVVERQGLSVGPDAQRAKVLVAPRDRYVTVDLPVVAGTRVLLLDAATRQPHARYLLRYEVIQDGVVVVRSNPGSVRSVRYDGDHESIRPILTEHFPCTVRLLGRPTTMGLFVNEQELGEYEVTHTDAGTTRMIEVEFAAPPAGTVEFDVRDAAGACVDAALKVIVRDAETRRRNGSTNLFGDAVPHVTLAPGAYGFTIEAYGFRRSELPAHEVGVNVTTRVVVVLTALALVHFIAEVPELSDGYDIEVTFMRSPGRRVESTPLPFERPRTEDGRYAYDVAAYLLRPGRYSFGVILRNITGPRFHAAGRPIVARFRVEGSETQEVRFRVHPIRVELLLEHGEDINRWARGRISRHGGTYEPEGSDNSIELPTVLWLLPDRWVVASSRPAAGGRNEYIRAEFELEAGAEQSPITLEFQRVGE